MTFSPIFAAGAASGIDFGRVLLELALIICAAKLVTEFTERIRVPSVLAEIALGLTLGPSAFGLIKHSDSLILFAELGAILLLVQVGLEMDVPALRTVGRAATSVALVGVALPMGLGTLGGIAIGEHTRTAIFVGATLTATSVGITARVFGDLRALATKEARIVLGAAVADDVLGLILLTIVTRIVERGTIGIATIASTTAVAVGFIGIAATVGFAAIPKLLQLVSRRAATPTALSITALGITLAFAGAADSAHLAPIIGAFIAGAAMSRAPGHERIAHDVSTLAAVFVPVFFVNIGVETDLGSVMRPKVLAIALFLSVIACATKISSGFAVRQRNVDEVLVGLGMMPRGEVGLIFATIGMGVGVLSDDVHAALILVVLVTTVVTPTALRRRIRRLQPSYSESESESGVEVEPEMGWLRVQAGRIELNAKPPVSASVEILLEAAQMTHDCQPGEELLAWINEHRDRAIHWNRRASGQLLELLRHGTPRSWRFLEASALFDRVLPEVGEAIRRRSRDVAELDSAQVARFPTVEALREATSVASSRNDALLLAAFTWDIDPDGGSSAAILSRLDLDAETVGEVSDLLNGARVLRSAVEREPTSVDDRRLREIAQGLKQPGTVERSRLLADAVGGLEPWQHAAMIDVITQIQVALADPDLLDRPDETLADLRRRQAVELIDDKALARRIESAPTSQILELDPAALVAKVRLVEPPPRRRNVRVTAESIDTRTFHVHVVCRDRRGLLARLAGSIADSGYTILSANLATWPDGTVLDSFIIAGDTEPDVVALANSFRRALGGRLRRRRLTKSTPTIRLDNSGHPWHSLLDVSGEDQVGLVAALSYALSRARIEVHHASIQTEAGSVKDVLEVSDRAGRKIDEPRLRHALAILDNG